MRIFIVEPNGRGGMIHYAYQLATAFAKVGVNVTLITSDDYELREFAHTFEVRPILRLWPQFDPHAGDPPRGAVARAWHRTRWNGRRLARGWRLVRAWKQLCRILEAERPDIVQFGKVHFPFEARYLAQLRRAGLTLAQVCHEFQLRERDGALARRLDRLYASIYPHFAAVFLHGERNREQFLQLFDYPADRAHAIAHGNESLFADAAPRTITVEQARVRYHLAADQPVLLFFGILAPSKGIEDLLRAWAIVHERHPRARLLIAGFPSKHIDMAALDRLAADAALGDSVTFDRRYIPLGEVAAVVETAAALVLPYRNATQSGALQLAYAFGKPVIATRVGGLPEAVEDEGSGLLVEPNDPAALAAAITRMLDDPVMTRRMGDRARHLCQTRYAWRPIAERMLIVYHALRAAEVAHR